MPIRGPTGRGTGTRRIGGSYANVNTPEQIIQGQRRVHGRKLREADRLLAEGAEIADVARHLELSEQTYHRWRNQFGGDSATPAGQLRAGRPDHVWAMDYQFDVTSTGRTIKILHVVDEFTRESLADLVDHSIDADAKRLTRWSSRPGDFRPLHHYLGPNCSGASWRPKSVDAVGVGTG